MKKLNKRIEDKIREFKRSELRKEFRQWEACFKVSLSDFDKPIYTNNYSIKSPKKFHLRDEIIPKVTSLQITFRPNKNSNGYDLGYGTIVNNSHRERIEVVQK